MQSSQFETKIKPQMNSEEVQQSQRTFLQRCLEYAISHKNLTFIGVFVFLFAGFMAVSALQANHAEAAFPTIAATNFGNSGGNTTTHTVNLPTGITAGNMLIVCISFDGGLNLSSGLTINSQAGTWQTIVSSGNASTMSFTCVYKIATGSEPSTFTISSTANEGSAHVSYRITGADTSTAPAVSTSATGTSANPNPGSLNPANWDVEDTLWISAYGWDNGSTAHTTYPANYTLSQLNTRWSNSNGSGIAMSARNNAVASEDPAQATIGASRAWFASTIAVRPAAPISISGTSNGSGTVRVAVNSSLQAQTGTIAGGNWTISNIAAPSSGNVITVWIDNVADSSESTGVTIYDGSGNITGMVLNTNTLTIGSDDNATVPITAFSNYACGNDEDVMHFADFSGDDYQLSAQGCTNSYADETIEVKASNTFQTNTNDFVTTDNMNIAGTFTVSAATTPTITVSGNWTESGIFNASTSTVVFSSTSTGQTITSGGSSFYNLTFNGAGGGWTLQDNTTVTQVLSLSAGTLSAGSVTLTLSGSSSPMVVTGGTFNAGTSTVVYTNATSATVAPVAYYNLNLSPSSGTPTYSLSDSLSWGVARTGSTPAFGSYDPVNGVLLFHSNSSLAKYRCAVSNGCESSGDWTSHNGANNSNGGYIYDPVNGAFLNGNATIERCLTSTNCDATGDWSTYSATPNTFMSMEVDTTTGVMYGGENITGAIWRCVLSSGCNEAGDWAIAYDTPESTIGSIGFDSITGVIYAGSSNSAIIYRCAINTPGSCNDSSDWTTSFDTAYASVSSLGFDSAAGVMYAGTATSGVILRCAINTPGSCNDSSDWTIAYDTAVSGIYALYFDTSTGKMYAGGSSGQVYSCSTSTVGSCNDSSDWVSEFTGSGDMRSIVGDGSGSVWVGTTNGGTSIYKGAASGNMSVSNNLTISANATFSAGSASITIGGNFTNSGTFNAGTGTVIFNDSGKTSVVSGSNTFNNVTVTTAGKNVDFTAGTTTTINGALTVTGSSGNNVVFDSTAASVWTINHQGTESITYMTVNWGACHGSSTTITMGTGSTKDGNSGTCWDPPALITISGTVYNDAGVTNIGANKTVVIKVGGADACPGLCTAETNASGQYSIANVAATLGAIVTIFLDGETENATTVTNSSGSNMSNIHLYRNHLIVRHETGSSIELDSMDAYDDANGGGDGDVVFAATTSSLAVNSGSTLMVWTGKTFTNSVTLGSDTITAPAMVVDGTLSGTFPGGVTVTGGGVTGAGSIYLASSDFTHNVTTNQSFGGTGLWAFGNLNLIGSGGTSTAVGGGGVQIATTLTVGTGHTFNAGSKSWTFSGTYGDPFIINGTFTAGTSTFSFNIFNNFVVPAATYYDLDIIPAGGAVATLGNGTFTIGGFLNMGDGSSMGTIDGTTNNPTITVTGNFSLQSLANFDASSGVLTVGGNFDIQGGFDPGTGSVVFNNSGTQTQVTSNVGGSVVADSFFAPDPWSFTLSTDFPNGTYIVGQSFTGNGGILDSITLRMIANGIPEYGLQMEIQNHIGTFGTSSLGGGTSLALSEVVQASSLSTFMTTDVTFTFTGANRIELADGVNYVFLLYDGGGSEFDNVGVEYEQGDATHPGNLIGEDYNNGQFYNASWDLTFQVNTVTSSEITFNDLTIATPGKTVLFQEGMTATIQGDIVITGNSSSNVTISSIDGSNPWYMNYLGTSHTINYVTLSFSGCDPDSDPLTVNNGIDGGDNGGCWNFASNITISGTCKKADKTTNCADAEFIGVYIGTTLYPGAMGTVSGTWTFNDIPKPASGTAITVYKAGVANNLEANAYLTYNGVGNITGVQLIEESLTINSGGLTVGWGELDTADNSVTGNEDIFFDVDAFGVLTVDSLGQFTQERLYIASGSSFQTNRTINTVDFENYGNFTLEASTNINVAGNFFNNTTASLTMQTASGLTMTATTSGKVITLGGDALMNLTFNGSGGGWSFADASNTISGDMNISVGTVTDSDSSLTINGGGLTGNGTLTLTGGTVTVTGHDNFSGNGNWTFNNLTLSGVGQTTSALGSGTVTIGGVLTVSASHSLNAGSKTWILSGTSTPLVVSGSLNQSTSTFRFTGNGATGILARAYNNLELMPSGSSAQVLSSGTYTINGNLVVGNGTNAGATGATNNPTVSVTGTMTIAANATYTAGTGALTVTGDFTNNGTMSNPATGSASFGANWANNGTISTTSGHTTTFTATDSGNTLTGAISCGVMRNIVFNGVGGSWTAPPMCGTDLTITAGSLTATSFYGASAGGAGTLTTTTGLTIQSGNLSNGGNWTIGTDLWFGDDSGTVTHTLSGAGTITVGGQFKIDATHTVNAGSKLIILNGNGTPFVKTGTFNGQTSTVSYRNTSSATVTAANYYNLYFDPASGSPTYTMAAGTFNIGGNMYIDISETASVTLNASANNPSIDVNGTLLAGAGETFSAPANTMYVGGSWAIPASSSFIHNNGTVVLDGPGTVSQANGAFYNLTVNIASGSMAASSDITVENVFTIASGDYYAGTGTLTLSGSGTPFVKTGGTFNYQTSTVHYNGGSATVLALNGSGTADAYYNLNIHTDNAIFPYTYTLGGNTTVNNVVTVGGNFCDGSANLALSNHILTLKGSGTPLNFTNCGLLDSGTGTVAYTSASGVTGLASKPLSGNRDLYNLTINGTGTFNVGASNTTMSVLNSFNISSGTFDAGSSSITVGRNFGGAGTFAGNTSTVEFNDAGVATLVSGSNTFYNLSIVTASKTVQFKEGTTTTINGLFTVTGGKSGNVVLTSDTGSSSWIINHQGTESITNLSVSWGACHVSSTTITLDDTNTNGGNNGACWGFATYITISGNLFANDETTPYTTSVAMKLAVGGSTSYTTSSTAGTGAFSFTSVVQPNNGDVITIWLDTNLSGTQSTLAFKYGNGCSGGDCTGLEMNLGQIKFDNYHTGNLSASDFTACHRNAGTACSGDADLGFYIFALANTNYLAASGWTFNEVKIPAGVTFTTPITSVSKLDIEGSLVNDTNYNQNSSIGGTGTNTDCSALDATPLCIRPGGSFTPSKSLWFSGTAATLVPAGTYNNLTIGPAANNVTYTFGAGTFEINGSLVMGYENWAYTGNVYDASVNNPNININGDLSALSVSAFATFNAGSGTITLNGKKATLFAIGTFNAQTSTVKYSNSSTANIAMVPYYNLVLDPAGESGTFVLENHDRQWMEAYHVGSGDARDVIYDAERQIAYMAMSNGGINRCDYFTTACDEQADWPTVHSAGVLIQRLFIDEANDVIYGVGNSGRVIRCDLTTGCDVTGEWSEVLNATTGLFSQMTKDTTNGYLFVGNGTNIYRCSVSTGCDAGADWSSSAFAATDPMYSAGNGRLYATLAGDVYSCATSTGCLASENWSTALDVSYTTSNRLSMDTANGVIFYAATNSTTNGAYSMTIYTCHVANTGCDATGDWVNSGTITNPATTVLNFDKFDASSGYIYASSNGYVYRCNYTATSCNELSDFEHELVFHKNVSYTQEVLPDGTMFIPMATSGAVWKGTVPTVFNQTVQNNLTVAAGATVLQGNSELTLQGNLTLESGSTFTAGTTGKVILDGPLNQTITDNNVTKQSLGVIQTSGAYAGEANVAASSNGGSVVASSSIAGGGYAASSAIDGYNYTGGSAPSWGSNGGWNDDTNGTWPDTLEVTFDDTYEIDQIDVYTLPDSYNGGVAPTLTDTFTQYGITNFTVEYWNGTGWTVIQNVANNNKVWNQITFTPVTTDKIRLTVNDGNGYSRVVELEAWKTTGGGASLGTDIKATSLVTDAGTSFSLGSGTLTLTANSNVITNNGTLDFGTGTVSFQPALNTGMTVPNLNYYNLDLNRSGNAFTVPNNLTVQNTLSITAGSVTAPETITVGGFINNGTFSHNNGTVIIAPAATGVAQIGGASSLIFNNLTNITPRTAMEFESGRTIQIDGAWNVTGSNGGNIWIRSNTPGVQWFIDLNGTSSINYVNVKDSGCSGSLNLTLGTKVFNQGNNGTCWRLVVRGSGAGSSGGGAGSGSSGGGGGGAGGGNASSQARGTATVSGGAVQSVQVTNGGSGYFLPPLVCFADSGSASETGATATAIVAGGAVTSIAVNTGGNGYTATTTVIIGAPGTSGGSCSSGSGGGGAGGGGGGVSP